MAGFLVSKNPLHVIFFFNNNNNILIKINLKVRTLLVESPSSIVPSYSVFEFHTDNTDTSRCSCMGIGRDSLLT